METKPEKIEKKPKLSKINRLMLVAFVIALVSVFAIFSLPNRAEEPSDESVNLNEIGFSIKSSEAGNYAPMGSDHVLWVDGSGLAILNVAGAELQRFDMIINDPLIVQNGDYTLVAEFDGYRYCVLSSKGLLYEGKTSDTIKSAAVSARGHAALIMDVQDSKGVLSVLDNKGNKLFDWYSQDKVESGYILGASFSTDNSRVLVSLLNTDSDLSFPVVNTFSLYSQDLGKKMSTLAPKDFGPVTYMRGIGPQRFLIASSRQVAILNPEGIETQISFARIHSVLSFDERILILAAEDENAALKLYNWNGSTEDAKRVGDAEYGEAAFMLRSHGSYFAIEDQRNVHVYSALGLNEIRVFSVAEGLIDGYVDKEAALLYLTRNEVKRLRY